MIDDELKLIINKITEGTHSEEDLSKLLQILKNTDNRHIALQLGKNGV
ncbi:hypothetical protein ACSQ6I_14765 [Anabaena sp. WFMT]